MNDRTFLKNYQSLKTAQKKGDGTPLYSRYVNRWLGQIFASFLAKWKISPNLITCISGAFTFGAYFTFLFLKDITFEASFYLYLLLVIGYALDSSDGLVSRLLNKQSIKGEWLDHTFDAIKIPLGHGALLLFILNNVEVSIYKQILMLIILVSASSLFLANILKSKLLKVKKNFVNINEKKIISSRRSFIKSTLVLPLDYGVFMVIFLFTSYPDLLTYIYLSWGIIFVLLTFISFIKSSKELS